MRQIVPGMMRRLWYDHLVGTPFERALLVRRRSADWLRAGVVFIHVPKAAGTSVSEALYGRFLGHARAADVKRWGAANVVSLPFVAVTRNPWDRLVSAYRFAKRGAGLGGGNPGAVWRPEQYAAPEFGTFERFVSDWLAKRNPRDLDLIFQPQCQFVCDEIGNVIVDHLGRFENLSETYAFLGAGKRNVPMARESNRSGDPVDYRTFYTPQLVELAASIYREDVERFGYTFD